MVDLLNGPISFDSSNLIQRLTCSPQAVVDPGHSRSRIELLTMQNCYHRHYVVLLLLWPIMLCILRYMIKAKSQFKSWQSQFLSV